MRVARPKTISLIRPPPHASRCVRWPLPPAGAANERAAARNRPRSTALHRVADEGRELLERTSAIKLRLLGDLVLRRNAWRYADDLGDASTYDAEYLALTRLQGDAFVTLDPELAKRAGAHVPTAPFDALLQG